MTIGGVDVGGMTADEADADRRRRAGRAAAQARHGHLRRASSTSSARRSSRSTPTSTGWSTARSTRARRAACRPASGATRPAARSTSRSRPRSPTPSKAIDEFIAKVAAEVNREPVDASIEPSAASLSRGPGPRRGRASTRTSCARGSSPRCRARRSRKVALPVESVEPEVTTEELAGAVSDLPDRQPLDLRADPVEGPRARRRPTRSRSAPRASTPRPASTTSRTRRSTRPGTCPTPTGPATSPARSSPAACPRTRSRRAGWGSTTAPASTAPTTSARSARAASHGCVRMAVPDVIELYDQVPVGTPIYIG